MMIKYRVHEVAKDLGLPNKEVIDTLQKYTGETKKHMTALTENELDVVFEEFTQKNRVESFDAYFADQKEPAVTVTAEQEPAAPQQPTAPAHPAQPQPNRNQAAPAKAPQQNGGAQGQQGNAPRRPAVKPGKITPVRPAPQQNGGQQGQQQRATTGKCAAPPAVKPGKITPVRPAPQQQQQKKPGAPIPPPRPMQTGAPNTTNVKRGEGRLVDTRASHVELDKYNEKYDRLASEKVRTENIVQKQKITQRSSQYRGKPRNARRETEAERLRRIAMERKAKPITVTIPEEITVNELALRLKATAAEVIKS